MQFGDTSAVEKQIYDTNNLATMRIGECEKNIELFLKIGGMKSESDQKGIF